MDHMSQISSPCSTLTSSESQGRWRGSALLCSGSSCLLSSWCPYTQNHTPSSASSQTPGSPPIHWPAIASYFLCGVHSLSEKRMTGKHEKTITLCFCWSHAWAFLSKCFDAEIKKKTTFLTLFCICSISIPKCDRCSDICGSKTASSSSNE